MSEQNNRYDYIDTLRGIAVLSIVAIHTAWWGGQSYVPEWFRSITLALDVPFFFFLSGWGASLHLGDIVRTSKRLGIIWLQWIAFITFIGLICVTVSFSEYNVLGLRGFQSIKDLLDSYAFHPTLPYSKLIKSSLWFIPYYFIAVLANTAMTILFSKSGNTERLNNLNKWYCVMLAVIFIWVTTGHFFFNIHPVVLFYCFFWMLGYNRKNINISTKSRLLEWLILVFVGYFISSRWLGISFWNVQKAKFPSSIQYAFWSMPMIFIALFFEHKITPPQKILAHIGKNAIFYFFAQGIACTVNYYFVKKIIDF